MIRERPKEKVLLVIFANLRKERGGRSEVM